MSKFQFMWCGDAELPAGWALQPHVHDFCHLAYVRRGHLIFRVDEVDYPLSEGSMILIPPHMTHGIPQDTHSLCIQCEVLVDIQDPGLKELLETRKVLVLHNATHLESLFTYVRMHYKSADPFSLSCVDSFLHTILCSFLVHQPSSEESSGGYVDTSRYSPLVQQIISFVEAKTTEKYDLSSLALSFGLNKSYICTVFRRETGVTISDYINYNRVRKILIVLQYTQYNKDFSIQALADQYGYENPSYFNRVFKKLTGITPMEFKSNISNDSDSSEQTAFQKYYNEYLDLKRYPIRESLEYMRGLKDVLEAEQ
ncbi:MAG: AraC family transcriptional regulator [Clostridia bacterium]|nr:AraC family transcriptional regulator [Clostridia bacterium]